MEEWWNEQIDKYLGNNIIRHFTMFIHSFELATATHSITLNLFWTIPIQDTSMQIHRSSA